VTPLGIRANSVFSEVVKYATRGRHRRRRRVNLCYSGCLYV